MLTIDQAYKEGCSSIEEAIKSSTTKLILLKAKESINSNLKDLINEREDTVKEIDKLYEEIIAKIKQRHLEVSNKINSDYMQLEAEYREKLVSIENQIFKIEDLNKILLDLPHLNKIALLRTKKMTLEHINDTMKISSININKKWSKAYKKDEDLLEVSKLILRQSHNDMKSKFLTTSINKQYYAQTSNMNSIKSGVEGSAPNSSNSIKSKAGKAFGGTKRSVGMPNMNCTFVKLPQNDEIPVSLGNKSRAKKSTKNTNECSLKSLKYSTERETKG